MSFVHRCLGAIGIVLFPNEDGLVDLAAIDAFLAYHHSKESPEMREERHKDCLLDTHSLCMADLTPLSS